MKNIIIILLILISKIAFCNIVIENTECDKVVYKPGESVNFSITLKNDAPGLIRVYLLKGLDEQVFLETREIDINNDFKTEEFSYTTNKDDEWGYGILFLIITDNETKRAYTYFACGDRPYYYGHYTTVCNRGYQTKEMCEKNITWCFKPGHYGAIEFFSWEPSMWETMAPKEDKWIGGQQGYLESKENIKTIIDTAHKCGMNAFAYHSFLSWGYEGSEYLRTHADWWSYDKFGKPFSDFNVYSIQITDQMKETIDPGVHPVPVCWDTANLVYPGMLEFYLDQIKQSFEMFNWDGLREDGLAYRKDTYNAEGELVKADPKLSKTDEFIRYMRKWIKENIGEDKTLHFNAGSVYYFLEKNPIENLLASGEDRSYILWEGSHYAYTKGHELNDMRNFVKWGNLEVSVARECNGQRYCYYESKTSEYIEAVTTAIGAKAETSCAMPLDDLHPWKPPVYRDFTFRFSEYFWPSDLKLVENPKELFEVNNNVFWDRTVQKKETKDKIYYIIHLINPTEEYCLTPDTLPKSLLNTEIKYLGKDKPYIYVLTPDFGEDNFVKSLGHKDTAIIPEIKIWSVVVFEIEK